MDTKKTQTPVLIAALLLLVALVLLVAYVIPKITTLKEMNQEISNKELELSVGKQKVQSIKDAAQLIQQAKKEVETLGIAIPTKEKAEESLLQITNIASQESISVINASFSSTDGSLVMSVTARGAYDKFVNFFNDLNANIRPVAVSGINFSSGEDSGSLEATFDLSLPYISDETNQNGMGENATDEGGQGE